MKIFSGRPASRVINAVLEPRYYIALMRHFINTDNPLVWFKRYISGGGEYPCIIKFRVKQRKCSAKLYCSHDLLTYNEIFSREDYPVEGTEKIIVDCGGNIGMSAVYFLLKCKPEKIYIYEPLPANIERLRGQPELIPSQIELRQFAVATEPGEAEFCVEPTGRYGSLVQRRTQDLIKVECRCLNTDLEELLKIHPKIDILKLDVEGVEEALILSLGKEVRLRIGSIFAEHPFTSNPIADTHSWRQNGPIAVFRLNAA